jgi:hypothetical protein
MEAHKSFELYEQGHQLGTGEESHVGPDYGRNAALVVAVMAALLAVAMFLSNESVKEVITGETDRVDTSGQLESNLLKIDVAEGNEVLLRVLAAGSAGEHQAAGLADRHEARVIRELGPADARLKSAIQTKEHEIDDANSRHVDYELAEVGLQIGIVLASVSIIARRRWLLGVSGLAATAGVAFMVAGLLV